MIRLNSALKMLVVAGMIVGLASGCSCRQKVAEKVAEKAMEHAIKADAKKQGKDVDVDVNLKGGSMSIKSKDGSQDVDVQMKDGKVSMKSKDGEETVTSDGDAGSFTMKTKDGTLTTTTGKNAKIPDGFPKDVPVYPGAEIVSATSMTQNENFSVQAKSGDAMAKVGEYYKKELAAQGWTEGTTMNQGGDNAMQMIQSSKADRSVMVMLSTEEGKTTIMVQTAKQ